MPRKLQEFVSRLHNDTIDEDLAAWFDSVGIPGVKCIKIKPADGRTYSIAAFKVI